MSAKTAAELAAQDPRLKAMLMELGSARFDDFPMEDGDGGKYGRDLRGYSNSPNLTAGAHCVTSKAPMKSAWAKAIQRGDFDDDDAAKVSGLDSMADGQLARTRRNQAAAATASNFPKHKDESHLRRDRNRNVPPRATVGNLGKRQVPGPIHVGDDPIDIDNTLSGARTDRRPHPMRAPFAPMSMFGRGAFAGGPSTQPPHRSQPATAMPRGGQIGQETRTLVHSDVSVVLPDGAAVILQLPSTLGATIFPEPSRKYPGQVYLVSGPQPSGDSIVLAVDDKKISEIRHFISHYDTYMSVDDTGLMLKFDNSENGFNFYGVEFESASNMITFVQNLRKLVERQKQPPQRAAPTSTLDVEGKQKASGTVPRAVNIKPPQPANGVPSESKEPAATRRSEMAANAPKKTDSFIQKPEERKDVIARRMAELLAKKQAESASASGQTSENSKPMDIEPINGRSNQNGTSGANKQATSPNFAIESPVAASRAPTSNNEEPDPPAPADVVPSTAIPAELKSYQAVKPPVQQIESSSGLHPDLIQDMIEWACDTARYMQHSTPEQFGFDALRTVIRASCAAVLGRMSPSFRQLSPAEQKKFVADYAQAQVESGFLEKLNHDKPVTAEFENTNVAQFRTSQQLPKVQTDAELQVDAPSKIPGLIYGIGELLSMRTVAAPIDSGMLPQIPCVSPKTSTPQRNTGLLRVPVEMQVKQMTAANSDWLEKRGPVQDVNGKADVLADFFCPISGQTTGSPSAGLGDSIHSRGGAQSQLTGAVGAKSIYQKDLEDLVTKSTDEGHAFNHEVVKATEGISRLSLN